MEACKKPTLKVLTKRRHVLARKATPTEIQFCHRLTGGRIKFYFQHLIPPYIVDIFIPKRMLIIELDGSHHYEAECLAYDERRTRYLENKGFKILRIPNKDASTWPLKLIRKYPKVKGCGRQTVRALREQFDSKGMRQLPAQSASREVKGAPF